MLLALDTSTRFASIALYNESGVQGEHTWHVEQNHTEDLMPHVVALMAAAHVVPANLTGVVVALGPGSFNGLRVAMSAAKGMAIALHIPIVGFSTLETLAYQHGSLSLPVRPILEGGGPDLATALYRVTRNHWAQVEEPRLATVDAICEATTQRTLFCGEISPALAAEFRQRLENAIIAPPAANARRAGYLAELGWLRIRDGNVDDAGALQPLYLRRPHITEPKKKSAHPRE
jgi:tRNA threonylcarbamoyladenosine biosynthesis protein TsaB